MRRFYVEPGSIDGAFARLSAEEVRHMRRVLRMQQGDACVVCDGRGSEYQAELTGDEAVLRIIEKKEGASEASLRVTLYQGLPKSDKMEWVIQKCAEMGAHAIVPVMMQRCDVVLGRKDYPKKLERWRRVCAEAVKQCGRAWIPPIGEPVAFDEMIGSIPAGGRFIFCWEESRKPISEAFRAVPPDTGELSLLIGPEGGISPDEAEALKRAGAAEASLGPRILRAETAGLAALTMAMYHFGQMERAR